MNKLVIPTKLIETWNTEVGNLCVGFLLFATELVHMVAFDPLHLSLGLDRWNRQNGDYAGHRVANMAAHKLICHEYSN